MEKVTEDTKKMIPKIQEYLATKPVKRAWLFGSCSRGEENADSDVDLLVSYMPDEKVTLFTVGGMYMDLKELLNREIDLVEEGMLMPYAKATADKDKTLIYERKD